MKQANVDRAAFLQLDDQFQKYIKRIDVMEKILFQKDDFGRMQLFDKIFSAIRKVELYAIEETSKIELIAKGNSF